MTIQISGDVETSRCLTIEVKQHVGLQEVFSTRHLALRHTGAKRHPVASGRHYRVTNFKKTLAVRMLITTDYTTLSTIMQYPPSTCRTQSRRDDLSTGSKGDKGVSKRVSSPLQLGVVHHLLQGGGLTHHVEPPQPRVSVAGVE